METSESTEDIWKKFKNLWGLLVFHGEYDQKWIYRRVNCRSERG